MPDRELIQAIGCLPQPMRAYLQPWIDQTRPTCEEIRLRAGMPLTVADAKSEHSAGGRALTPQMLQDTVDRACNYSAHTFAAGLSQGYVTLPGGHRMGLCGEAVWNDGTITAFRHISSVNLRIARQRKGAAPPEVIQAVTRGGHLHSAVVFSPPQYGKTTMLRDLARQLSEQGHRVGIADERGELAALYRGQPQFSIGPCADVICGCPKAEAALMLVKTMSPEVIVLDEITTEQDIHAALYGSHCGVAVLASAHAADFHDFQTRPLYRRILESEVFSLYLQLNKDHTLQKIIREEGGK